MNEWNIQSRAHACQACETRFTDKELYNTLLATNHHELQRLDICKKCWDATYAEGITSRKGYISHWHALYHAPPPAPVEAIQKESAETLLRKLIEANDPKHGAACYILAVMLERKRLLKIKEQFKRDGVRVFIYEQPKTGDLFTISDPNLQLNQLEEVQRDVADLLVHGLPQTAPLPQPVPAAVEEAPVASETADAPKALEAAAQPSEPPVQEPAAAAPTESAIAHLPSAICNVPSALRPVPEPASTPAESGLTIAEISAEPLPTLDSQPEPPGDSRA